MLMRETKDSRGELQYTFAPGRFKARHTELLHYGLTVSKSRKRKTLTERPDDDVDKDVVLVV